MTWYKCLFLNVMVEVTHQTAEFCSTLKVIKPAQALHYKQK